MVTLLAFAATLLVAVLISERASRSVLSTAVLFLVVGFLAGAVLDLLPLAGDDDAVRRIAEVALFTVLFTDGMRVGARDLRHAWRLPGRALLFGLPLTLLATAGLAWWLGDLTWPLALLIGAALAPTDPVFAAALVGREEVPGRLRQLLNVESGLNDGLALPVVIVLLARLGEGHAPYAALGGEVLLGIGIGVAVPWLAARLEATRGFAMVAVYEPLFAVSVGLLVFAVTALSHANMFLAAFAAGITVATVHTRARDEFHRFGEIVAELLKLAALLLFGALVEPAFFADLGWGDYLFVFGALFVARPVGLWIALAGSGLDWKEKLAAFWFGPKGFASVVYALLIYDAIGGRVGSHMFHLMAVVIAVSILAHSSTDVVVARWFRRTEETEDGELDAETPAAGGGEPEPAEPAI